MFMEHSFLLLCSEQWANCKNAVKMLVNKTSQKRLSIKKYHVEA